MQITTCEAIRCVRCGSTARTAYHTTRIIEIHDDPRFTQIRTRKTTCKRCGQPRLERTLENENGKH